MASNIGIDFKTPEEHFLGEEAAPFTRRFEPTHFLSDTSSDLADTVPNAFHKTALHDLVIMCGSPGCGKSTFYWQNLKPLGYERVNQDTLKTRDRCIRAATAFISDGKSVAVDNTNADADTRAIWVKLAQKSNIPIRCVHFTAPAKLCEHNATVRALAAPTNFNPEKREILPHAAFAGFASRFKEPMAKEGFQDIIRIDFQVSVQFVSRTNPYGGASK